MNLIETLISELRAELCADLATSKSKWLSIAWFQDSTTHEQQVRAERLCEKLKQDPFKIRQLYELCYQDGQEALVGKTNTSLLSRFEQASDSIKQQPSNPVSVIFLWLTSEYSKSLWSDLLSQEARLRQIMPNGVFYRRFAQHPSLRLVNQAKPSFERLAAYFYQQRATEYFQLFMQAFFGITGHRAMREQLRWEQHDTLGTAVETAVKLLPDSELRVPLWEIIDAGESDDSDQQVKDLLLSKLPSIYAALQENLLRGAFYGDHYCLLWQHIVTRALYEYTSSEGPQRLGVVSVSQEQWLQEIVYVEQLHPLLGTQMRADRAYCLAQLEPINREDCLQQSRTAITKACNLAREQPELKASLTIYPDDLKELIPASCCQTPTPQAFRQALQTLTGGVKNIAAFNISSK